MRITAKQAKVPPKQTEESFLRQVLELAKLYGWHTAHFRSARTSKGWRTAVQGDGKGFVDVVLVRERVIFVEIKNDRGNRSAEQLWWAQWLDRAKAEYYCWKPSDWDTIVRILGR
jgi:hypothetical protein